MDVLVDDVSVLNVSVVTDGSSVTVVLPEGSVVETTDGSSVAGTVSDSSVLVADSLPNVAVLDVPGSEVSRALVTDGSSVGEYVADRLVVVDGSSEMAVLEASVVTDGSPVLLPVGTEASEDVVATGAASVVSLLDTLVSEV